jgi:hypothetical protein
MSQEQYYSRIRQFGPENWKESLGDYLDRYHTWMISQGYYKA